MRRGLALSGLGLILLACAALGAALGAVPLPLGLLPGVLLTHQPDWAWQILWRLRLPRVLMAVFVGAGLGTAGAIFQTLFRNPLADPFLLGVSSGAALGAVATMALAFALPAVVSFAWTTPVALVAGVVTLFFVYAVSRAGGGVSTVSLILAGSAVSSFLSAIVSLIVLFNQAHLAPLYFWLLGGLSSASWAQVRWAGPLTLIALIVAALATKELNALLLGEEAAHNLGVDVRSARLKLALLGTLLAAVAVAYTGMIGFVGLIIPHAARLVGGAEHRWLIPASALAGSAFLILADLAARTIMSPSELPVGVVTAFLGAPFFIWLLRRKARSGWLE